MGEKGRECYNSKDPIYLNLALAENSKNRIPIISSLAPGPAQCAMHSNCSVSSYGMTERKLAVAVVLLLWRWNDFPLFCYGPHPRHISPEGALRGYPCQRAGNGLGLSASGLHFLFVCLFVCLFMAAPTAHGGSQARGPIGTIATGLHQSHSNMGSKPHLQPTPQLTATLDP